MITGAARAEAALLIIDAGEGIQENSRRHGYLLHTLGIKQVAVCVNKIDLVDYQEEVFNKIAAEYKDFLLKFKCVPKQFIPVSAKEGDNIITASSKMGWYSGPSVLGCLDSFTREESPEEKYFSLPVQGVYKFTGGGDDRRIVAGRIESGKIKEGEEVVFFPSEKTTRIKSIEAFNGPKKVSASAGWSIGVTLTDHLYIKRGEVMAKNGEIRPLIGQSFKANIFWMGKTPLELGKEYKLKLATQSTPMAVTEIMKVMDSSSLASGKKNLVARNEVAECILQAKKDLVFDLFGNHAPLGRFVIVDQYDIAGGGIIIESVNNKPGEYPIRNLRGRKCLGIELRREIKDFGRAELLIDHQPLLLDISDFCLEHNFKFEFEKLDEDIRVLINKNNSQ